MSRPLPLPRPIPLSETLSALTFALDLAEGQPMGHALRSTLIGMALGDRIGLPEAERADLYFALLLKDIGCSGNAAVVHEVFGSSDLESKRAFKFVDWSRFIHSARYALSRVRPGREWLRRVTGLAQAARDGHDLTRRIIELRCTRGAEIARTLGFNPAVATAVAALDEHWDGGGQPLGLATTAIPPAARIMGLAQTLEVFATRHGVDAALRTARQRRGRWFDPALVDAAGALEPELTGWLTLDESGLQRAVEALAPANGAARPATLDQVARCFAEVIDAKSPYTARHSERMAGIAVAIARTLGNDAESCRDLERAGLLHDIGKLSVPNAILDKPGRLTPAEWEVVRLHPYYTQRILERVTALSDLAWVASSHHERLDGRGYFRGLRGEQVPTGARVLAVADVYEALTARRPYREGLPVERALEIMEADRGTAFDPDCLDGLRAVVAAAAPDHRAPAPPLRRAA